MIDTITFQSTPARPRRASIGSAALTGRERLLQAIGRREVFLEYQPVISLSNDELTSAEALVRWRHPRLGTLLPKAFVPTAEADGSIDALGLWVLDQAVADRRRWLDLGLDPFPVAVNLSARQLRDHQLADRVRGCLDRHGLPANLLRLELTESAPMPPASTAESSIAALARLGIELCIDDFSMGHASVLALASGHFRQIKIPRELISGTARNSRTDTVVEWLIELGHRLGLTVIAEGVESEQQRAFLRARRCDDAQGYLFGRPTEAGQLVERLTDQRITRPISRHEIRSSYGC